MKQVCEKLDILKSTKSSNEKIELLKEYLEDEKFMSVVELCLDETMQYNIKKLPKVKEKKEVPFYTLVDYLYYLSEKQGAKKSEKEELASFLIDSYWERVVQLILNKKLDCGIAARMVNKVIPDLLTIYPYMRYSDFEKLKHIKYPAYNQRKEDGLFDNMFVNFQNNHVIHKTRNGNILDFPEAGLKNGMLSVEYPKEFISETLVFMGELRIKINGKWLPRKKSNGIVNKALKKNGTILLEESEKVHFICWDVVTENEFWKGVSNTPYFERLEMVKYLNRSYSERILVSETKIVENLKDAKTWALELISLGEEGTVLKNIDSIWEDKPSGTNDGVKLKAGGLEEGSDRECELKVVDWYYGKKGTKYEKCLGGLVCESYDGKIVTNIGGGFSDPQRGFIGFDDSGKPLSQDDIEEWIEEKYLYSIITVRFNEIISKDGRNTDSLFLGRFVEVRHEKTKADDYEYIKNLGA